MPAKGFAPNDPQTPPPPYEVSRQQAGDQFVGAHRHEEQQTIPKLTGSATDQAQDWQFRQQQGDTLSETPQQNDNGTGHRLQLQAQHYNTHHSCVLSSGGRKSQAAINNRPIATTTESRSQLIESLSAPDRWFNRITIEPVAFLAIMALFIEFPSIQDLIYTKICLQVIGSNPNLTIASAATTSFLIPSVTTTPSIIASNLSRISRESSELDSLGTTWIDSTRQNSISHLTEAIATDVTTNTLPTQGRILQPTSQNYSIINSNDAIFSHQNYQDQAAAATTTTIGLLNSSRVHLLCDKFNKTAVPAELRQEIKDGFSLFWLKYNLIICLLCTLSTPYWGGVSDKVGRLIPLNVPIVVAIISNLISLIFGLLISLDSHNLFRADWLYLGAVLVGLSGGQSSIIVNSFSFISDNTSSESRSKRIVILESVIFLSHSAGFYISSLITSLGLESFETSPWLNRHFVAFLACVSINIICVLYSMAKLRHLKYHRFLNNFEREQQEASAGDIIPAGGSSLGRRIVLESSKARVVGCISQDCVDNDLYDSGAATTSTKTNIADRSLRELTSSTPDDLDGPIARADKSWLTWATIFTFNYYKQTYVTATKRRESRSLIQLLLLSGFISSMSLTTLMSLLFVYSHSDPFNWTTSQYSSWNSYTSISRGIALIVLSLGMKFVSTWNVPDPLVAALGFLSKGAGLLMIALANSSTIIDWAILALVFSEYSMPPIRSLLSKLVVREEVGKIYSCLAAIQNVCFLIGSIVFYFAYNSLGLQDFFRLSFLVVACFQFGAVIVMFTVYNILRRRVMII